MAKHHNELDDLIEYQEKQYLPHANLMRNGKVSYPMRQLAKQPGKMAILYLLLLPGILLAVASSLRRLLEDFGDTGALVTGITTALVAIIYILLVAAGLKKAKQAREAAQAKKKQQKRKKKRR